MCAGDISYPTRVCYFSCRSYAALIDSLLQGCVAAAFAPHAVSRPRRRVDLISRLFHMLSACTDVLFTALASKERPAGQGACRLRAEASVQFATAWRRLNGLSLSRPSTRAIYVPPVSCRYGSQPTGRKSWASRRSSRLISKPASVRTVMSTSHACSDFLPRQPCGLLRSSRRSECSRGTARAVDALA